MNRKEKAIGGKQLTVDKTILPKPTLMKMDLQYFSEEVAEETVGNIADAEIITVTAEGFSVKDATIKTEVVGATETEAVDEAETGEDALLSQLAAELAVIKTELNAIKATTETVEETVEVEEVPEVKEVSPEIAAYEAVLETVIAEKAAAVPENIIALMPDNLSAVEKLEWITKAEKAVPQEKPVEETVETKVVIESIGKPTPVPTETAVDITKLSAAQKMLHGIETFFHKDNKGD